MESIKRTVLEVIYAVLPIILIIYILQFSVLSLPIDDVIQFTIGMILISTGLIIFLLGIHLGLLAIGEDIGTKITLFGNLWIIILCGFLVGFVVTVAEPDVRVLATQFDMVTGGTISKSTLIISIALGVGIFVALALVRIIKSIPIRNILLASYALIFLLAVIVDERFVPIGMDAGGVTTGPITVPFILALGLGVASVFKSKDSATDGFGLVGLASVGPIIAVLLLGVLH